MATLDRLLISFSKNEMDLIEMAPGQVPVMRKGTRSWKVSKSTMSAREIERQITEIVPERSEFPPPLPYTTYEFEYPVEEAVFHFRARRRAEGWTAGAVAREPGAEPIKPGPFREEKIAIEERERKPIRSIKDALELGHTKRASDLHLNSTQVPRVRVDGDLQVLRQYEPPTEEHMRKLLLEIMPPRNQEEFENTNDTDFGIDLPGTARYRVNVFRDRNGIGSVFREIPSSIPSADDIHLSDEIRKLAYLDQGLVLLTGPTGSGKSTSLASIIDLINRNRHDHIITIEDPIEFVHPSHQCLVNQREVCEHTGSFSNALRAALREDPDVILVGEMRDLETSSIAVETAETGHLVFGTLHTTTAVSTIDRLIDQFPADHQEQIRIMLADSLKAVISQVLLKRIGGGRIAAREVLLVNSAVSNLIREAKTFQIISIMQTNRNLGMCTLNDSLAELVKSKQVDPKEAYLKSPDREDLLRRFGGLGIGRGFLREIAA